MNTRLLSLAILLVILLSSLVIVLLQSLNSGRPSGGKQHVDSLSFYNNFARDRAQMMVQSNHLQITISIIAMNRLKSLKRLCNSILSMQNPNRVQVNLLFSLEAVSSAEMVAYISSLEWHFGWKIIKKRIQQGGLITAVTESWFPSSDSELGMFLEDDIEVSPLCILWIENVLRSPVVRDDRLMGISLYTPRVTETIALNMSQKLKSQPRHHKATKVKIKGVSRVVFRSDEITMRLVGDPKAAFLMQTPCSWGAVFFPRQWMRFLDYMRHRIATKEQEPPFHIQGSLTNGWQGSWKKYMFELMWAQDKFMLYPNFPGQASLSTNKMEPGVHVRSDILNNHSWILKWQYTVPLLTDLEVLNSVTIPTTLSKIPALDLFGESFNTDESLGLAVTHLQCESCQSLGEGNRFFLDRRRNVRHSVHCHRFANVTFALLADPTKLTISISTKDRYEAMLYQIRYYTQSPLVSKIIVTWHDTKKPVPRSAIVNDVPVHFISYASDSLNNRYSPWMQITTEAVLMLDDDMRLHLEDLHLLFEVWKQHPENLVGFMPRGMVVSPDDKGDAKTFPQFVYVPGNEDPPLGSPKHTRPREGYDIMLTQALLMHKKHLYTYTCDAEVQRSGLHVMVDAHKTCDDIFMNGVVATASSGFLNAPPLFVHPIHPIGDFGSLLNNPDPPREQVEIRTKCLNLVNRYHYEKTGMLLPTQTNVVVPFRIDGTKSSPPRVSMRLTRYTGIHHKYIHECLRAGNNEEVGYVNSEACSWNPPQYADMFSLGQGFNLKHEQPKERSSLEAKATKQFPVYSWDDNSRAAR